VSLHAENLRFLDSVPSGFQLPALTSKGDTSMLGIIAAVLIVLWLLGFFAFHVSTGVVHILLIIGLVMLALHFFRGRSSTV
jgi:hypothetical protein